MLQLTYGVVVSGLFDTYQHWQKLRPPSTEVRVA